MKLIDGLVFATVGDEFMLVPTSDAAKKLSGIIRLNETAYDIVTGIKNGLTEEEICTMLLEKYERVSKEKAQDAVRSIINRLKENGLLED